MDERVYRIVMSHPIPDKLIRNIGRVPLLQPYAIRRNAHRKHITQNLVATLLLVCQGFTNKEIAAQRHYSEEAVKDHVKRLLALFQARNRAHLAALAVARGLVDMNDHPLKEAA